MTVLLFDWAYKREGSHESTKRHETYKVAFSSTVDEWIRTRILQGDGLPSDGGGGSVILSAPSAGSEYRLNENKLWSGTPVHRIRTAEGSRSYLQYSDLLTAFGRWRAIVSTHHLR